MADNFTQAMDPAGRFLNEYSELHRKQNDIFEMIHVLRQQAEIISNSLVKAYKYCLRCQKE